MRGMRAAAVGTMFLCGSALRTQASPAVYVTFAPPATVGQAKVFRYTAPYFGFCARGVACKGGERWLSNARAVEARWEAPYSVSLEELDRHYKRVFRNEGWTLLGVHLDDIAQRQHLSAMKEQGGFVRGVDVTVSTTGLDGEGERIRIIDYWEGEGTPIAGERPSLNAKPAPKPARKR